MTTSESPLHIENLPDDAKEEAIALGEQIRQEDRFGQIGDEESGQYEAWSDIEKLVGMSRRFIKTFEPLMKPSAGEIRITAIRITKTATVPVKAGSSVDLIPVSFISETPSISKQPLKIGQYVRLTQTTSVAPGFICLLLLSQ